MRMNNELTGRGRVFAAATLLWTGLAASAVAQVDPLAIYEGSWINSAQSIVIFSKVSGGRMVGLPTGQAMLRSSNGEGGSNIRMSGEGFDCFYLASPIDAKTIGWELKNGSSVCPPSTRLQKLPSPDEPKPAPAPPPPPPASTYVAPPAPPPTLLPAQSNWYHNGSTMSVVVQGNDITILYAAPRKGMMDEGVRSGTILFRGRMSGTRLTGTSFVFDRRCAKPIPYPDRGEVSDDGREINLEGQRVPTQLDFNDGCRAVGYRYDPSQFVRR